MEVAGEVLLLMVMVAIEMHQDGEVIQQDNMKYKQDQEYLEQRMNAEKSFDKVYLPKGGLEAELNKDAWGDEDGR